MLLMGKYTISMVIFNSFSYGFPMVFPKNSMGTTRLVPLGELLRNKEIAPGFAGAKAVAPSEP